MFRWRSPDVSSLGTSPTIGDEVADEMDAGRA
jgi:hypothetical protein